MGYELASEDCLDIGAHDARVVVADLAGNVEPIAQALACKRVDEGVLARRGEDNLQDALELVIVVGHVADCDEREADGPYPAHLSDPVVLPFQRLLLAEGIRVLAVAQALGMLHAALRRRVMDRQERLAAVVEPILLFQAECVTALSDHAAVRVAATARLAHVQRHVVGDFAVFAACSNVEVCREHGGRHVAHLGADDVPRAGVEFLLHAILGELDDAAGHILCLVAVVAPDGADPGGALHEFGNVPLIVEGVQIIEQFLFATRAGSAVHHVRNLADLRSAVLPVVV